MSTTSINTEAKGLLAKLLATEDIIVEHQPVHTAMFNTESRTLTLPIWKDASNSLYDMLVGHEVGHALFTPDVDFDEVFSRMDPTNSIPESTRMDYLNVVEDARIEKDIQSRFPGLRRDFRAAYNELLDRDFFGIDGIEDLTEMSFIDRVNLHFKVGTILDIPFTSEEMVLVEMVDDCEDFDDVIEAATTLMNYSASKQESKQDQDGEMMPSGEEGAEDQQGASPDGQSDTTENEDSQGDGGSTEGDGTEDSSSDTDGDGDEEGQSSTSTSDGASKGGQMPAKATTASALSENLKKIAEEQNDRYTRDYVTIPKRLDLSNTIVSIEDVMESYRYVVNAGQGAGGMRYERCLKAALDFQKQSQKIVGNMVKRFEMRKAAEESKRAMTADTGILDTVKMINYRWSEDIFLRSTTVDEGQSHGLVMFVDWSGSMSPNIFDTVKQLLVLAMFCKKVGIPFDVYAFTSHWSRDKAYYRADIKADDRWDGERETSASGLKVGDVECCTEMHLVNVLSSSLRRADWIECFTYLFSEGMMQDYNAMAGWGITNPRMRLGGTPLDDAITAARQIVQDFKSKHGIQIVNTVFLTDGCSNSGPVNVGRKWNGTSWEDGYSSHRILRSDDGTIFDNGNGWNTSTDDLFEWLEHETDAPVIGIYLTEGGRNAHYAIPHTFGRKTTEKMAESLYSDGAVSCGRAKGYTEYIIMLAECRKKIKGLDDVKVGSNSRVVANAMIREAKKKKGMTKIMDIFVDRICGHGI